MKKFPALLLLSSIVLFSGCSKEVRTIAFFEDPKNIDTSAQVMIDCRNKNNWDTDKECENVKTALINPSSRVYKLFTADQHLKIAAAFDGLSVEEYKKRKEERAEEIKRKIK